MLPLIGMMLLVLLVGTAATIILKEKYSRLVACIFSGIVILLAFTILAYSISAGSVNIAESYSYYIQQLNVGFNLQLSAISLALVLMASVVAFVTILSGNIEREKEKVANSLTLLFEFAAIGLFASGNLIIFFVFWDIGVIALFFMLYLLGSTNRKRAATKFIMYELLASMLLLFAIMTIYFYTPLHSFDINYIIANASIVPLNLQILIFAFLFVAFLINMPVFPVHLWLPDAHTEASTQGSMLLSGILTKFGGYGMILAFLMMPVALQYSKEIVILAGFSAFYAAFVLMTQHDIKRIIAYTTIVEMSIILVGISAFNLIGTAGATFAMMAHGFAIAMLFLVAGSIGYMHSDRNISSLRGVIKGSLSTGYTFLAGIFVITGVPLTAAFIGDILIFIGAITTFSILGAVPLLALALMGAFMYYVINKSVISTKEISPSVEYIGMSQKIGYSILLFFIFLFGLLPFIILNLFNLVSI